MSESTGFLTRLDGLRAAIESGGNRKNLALLAICTLLMDLSPTDRTAALQEILDCCRLRVRRVRKSTADNSAVEMRALH